MGRSYCCLWPPHGKVWEREPDSAWRCMVIGQEGIDTIWNKRNSTRNQKKVHFHHEWGQILDQRSTEVRGVTVLGDIELWAGQCPEQLHLVGSAWVGVWTSLPPEDPAPLCDFVWLELLHSELSPSPDICITWLSTSPKRWSSSGKIKKKVREANSWIAAGWEGPGLCSNFLHVCKRARNKSIWTGKENNDGS